jgi:hypothetical protein
VQGRGVRPGRAFLLAALLAAAVPAPAAPPTSVLASYSFEDDVATGPDTFAIWQGARHTSTGRGRVGLSGAFHLSGYRSVEIQDVAGDGDFPELQGYFPLRSAGRLFFHFAFLTADATEELNVALAGPRCFQVEKDGIAFWLATRGGQLVHVSAGAERRLFAVEAFVWYAVDVVYDLAAGTYTLTVRREGVDAPLVRLRGQRNAPGVPSSSVDKFSFVGSPLQDTSNVHYYLDDVMVGTDESVTQVPFVAPGRRKLFVDLFAEHQRRLRERPRCLAVAAPEDLGLRARDLAGVGRDALALIARSVLGGERLDAARIAELTAPWRALFAPAVEWKTGCDLLDRGEVAGALARFDAAAAAAPEAPLIGLSRVVALAALRRFDEADAALMGLADARDDVRYAVVAAYVGIARGDLERAEAALDPGAATEEYYFVQLWRARYDGARDYALAMAERARQAGRSPSLWRGRAADAAFFRRDLSEARDLYLAAIAGEADHAALMWLYLKLADVAHLTGDLDGERALREHYYGTLAE